ncbi:MAG: DUF5684 domain-containing protein [bacterium]
MYDPNPAAGLIGDFLLVAILGLYLFCAYTQYRIANKVGCSDNAWWSYIPIMNAILLMDMAGKERWWTFLCLVPLVNIIVFAVVWFEVAKACGFDGWIGLLVLLPGLNLIALSILAFAGGSSAQGETPRSGQIDPKKLTPVG